MTFFTLDDLENEIKKMKESGVPGNTPVVRAEPDNNGRPGMFKRVEGVLTAHIAKPDFEKGWELCKAVRVRGVLVVNIH